MDRTTILFDLDGTLTDSEPGIVASYRHALNSFGLESEDRAIRRWIGPPLAEGFLALGIPHDDLPTAIATYRSYYASTGLYQNQLYDGVTAMLHNLSTAGIRLAIATSKLTEFAEVVAENFGMSSYFVVVAGASRDGRRITKGDIVGHALDSLGQPDPSSVALVGDREHDVYAAREWGLLPIGVTWGYGTAAELIEAGAEHCTASPAELTHLLLGVQEAH